MHEEVDRSIAAEFGLLEEHVGTLVSRLEECRKENDLLRSELATLQNILRSCKLPGTGSVSMSGQGAELTHADKLRVKQKLVLILQKIEMELRTNRNL
ncbi:MAG: hypothetical protein K9I59_06960 [Chlorobium sp.]|jgi:hypothetical protein|uniref:hypothetical protein n=1 Tax=Chlorobium sp. TaxID=1095 RepID=UPI001D7D4533|nr:hypothetical protein [Chlorobium sp.]MBN1279470.1 hypothetical protein [Chlorobiaceae bacterium]MCF8216507.1 hypothetical protein [Chlorobium sp.]MCF8271412.1 hypothetical protein [Chlorobium sp.]MCF8287784.1 hypothetical protein [Chlorobium sp.]MCF8291323.1 hypothetical protein [Chlorobium sp.]